MVWGPDAQQATIRLYKSGATETSIVATVRPEFDCDDKSVRRCIAAMDLIRQGATGSEGELTAISDGSLGREAGSLADRFEKLGGTDRYIKELRRVYEEKRSLPLAGRTSAPEEHYRELMAFGVRMRDRLTFAAVFHTRPARLHGVPLWLGEQFAPAENPEETLEERRVIESWSTGLGDRRFQPLFGPFREHLKYHPCWSTLESIDVGFRHMLQIDDALMEAVGQNVATGPDTGMSSEHLMDILRERQLWVLREESLSMEQRLVQDSVLEDGFQRHNWGGPIVRAGGWLLGRGPIDPDVARVLVTIVSSPNTMKLLGDWRKAALDLGWLRYKWLHEMGYEHDLRHAVVTGECARCPV